MTFLAVVRYQLATACRSQRWIAPAASYVLLVLLLNTDPGPALGTLGTTIAGLVPVATWLTLVTVNADDGPQAAITAVTAGGVSTARVAAVVAGTVLGLPLAVLGAAFPVAAGQSRQGLSIATVAIAGSAGHALALVIGAAIGSVISRPLLDRAGVAFLVGSGAALVEILVPGFPPARQLLALFDRSVPAQVLAHVGVTAAQTAAIAIALVIGSSWAARRRS